MSQVQQAGKYRGKPIFWNIEPRKNGMLQAAMTYAITHFKVGVEWQDVGEHGMEIKAWHILQKNDGEVNDKTFETFVNLFGWSGDFKEFNDTDQSQIICELVVEMGDAREDGKQYYEVKFLNIPGEAKEKTSESTIGDLDAKWGTKFRAAAKQVIKVPVRKPDPSRPAASPPVAAAPPSQKALAWIAYQQRSESLGKSKEAIGVDWKAMVIKWCPGIEPKDIPDTTFGEMIAANFVKPEPKTLAEVVGPSDESIPF